MSTLTYRLPKNNRKLANTIDGSLVVDSIQVLSGMLSQEQINKLTELSLSRSKEVYEIVLSSNITIRNIQKFYHFDDVKKNPDVAELVIKNNNLAFLRHFFNKVLNKPNVYCLANLIEDDLSFDSIKIISPVVSENGFGTDYNNDEARYFEKEN